MSEASTFPLTIASVGETHFAGSATSATFPGTGGEFTVLAHHEPLVTTLKRGVITVRASQGTQEFPLESGILECSSNKVTVLL